MTRELGGSHGQSLLCGGNIGTAATGRRMEELDKSGI